MSKIGKLEALIASPPTEKCKEMMAMLEGYVRRYPEKLRLIVYTRGVDLFPDEATGGMKTMFQKGSPVPTLVVNGMFFSSNVIPNRDELETRIQQLLQNLDP
jgi:hypothetical protein